jgi:2-keto-4-pentenoate hydratase/2-oxohepta-3-ene-1,7-dioic acid hydratase in catechol pathway
MRLATLIVDRNEYAAIGEKTGALPIEDLNRAFQTNWPTTIEKLIETGSLGELNTWYRLEGRQALGRKTLSYLAASQIRYAPLLRHPPKIWGIGLNYSAHARDLSESAPTSAPASFMKPDTAIIGPGDDIRIPKLSEKTAIIGPGDDIRIPKLSEKTTAEAELGIVIGKRCKDVPPESWLEVVAGFTTILDMTAEDILRQNPRYLTMSKSFDTFISIGPQLLTPDEIDDVRRLKVATVINGKVHAENTVAQMTFLPDRLVSYHSQVMTLLPGDIISTGTPGAVTIQHGDRVACRISGFEALHNPVVDLKRL